MREYETRFVQALDNFDFIESRRIIDDVLRNDKGIDFSLYMKQRAEVQSEKDLRYRDHVFKYFHLEDVYFALRMTSYEILSKLSYVQTSEEGRQDAFDLVITAAKAGDPTVRLNALDVEQIYNTEYAVLLPFVLTHRQEELTSIKIPFSLRTRAPRTMRYLIDELVETYYGLKIAVAAQEHQTLEVLVGSTVFAKIEAALTSMGIDLTDLLVEVHDDDWLKFVSDRQRFAYRPGEKSVELDTVRELFLSGQLIDVGNEAATRGVIDLVSNTKTATFNHILKRLASERSSRSNPSIQLRCLELLGERGDESDREFLAGLLLGDSTKRVRDASAKALSMLESRIAWRSKPSAPRVEPYINRDPISQDLASIVKELMGNVRKSNLSMISDALFSLASVGGQNATSLLTELVSHPEPIIRFNVVRAARRLSRQDAFQIIKKALDDENSMVSNAALVQLEERWPDHVIP